MQKIADAVFDRSLHKRWLLKINFHRPPLSQSYRQKICRPLFSASSSESGIAHLNTGVAEQNIFIFRGAPLRLRRSNPSFLLKHPPQGKEHAVRRGSGVKRGQSLSNKAPLRLRRSNPLVFCRLPARERARGAAWSASIAWPIPHLPPSFQFISPTR